MTCALQGTRIVSGNHASLSYEQGSLFLADQGSRNRSFSMTSEWQGAPAVVRGRVTISVFVSRSSRLHRRPPSLAGEESLRGRW